MLLTRAPVAGGRVAAPPLPLDLHVLGLSLAFILSQDQTLRCCYLCSFFFSLSAAPRLRAAGGRPPTAPTPVPSSGYAYYCTLSGLDADSGKAD